MEGSYEPSWVWVAPNWEDVEMSIVGFASGPGMTEEMLVSLEAFVGEMIAFASDPANEGAFFLWEGPLNLQDGTELAADGEFVDPLEIWYLPQLLEGMTGASQ
jgi:simple sugar transport system substrate-binding protein